MPVVTVYRHGGKGGVAPGRNDHTRMKRGDVEGWSLGATRRNTQFLMSVRETELTGAGVALTLTLRDCPASAQDWTKLRKRWIERQRRAGMVRLHWITEWQRRGVPHLHVALWWPDKYRLSDPVNDWVELAGELYGAGHRGQHAKVIDGPIGWFQYLSKHAARGVKHYQRNNENIPEAWLRKTGRVWGHSGDWPLDAPRKFGLQGAQGDAGWYWMRRMVRGWRLADARAAGDRRRILYARGSFRSPEPELSKLRGYQDWMPAEPVQLRMLA
ncbi:replication protein, partial [Henriciella mobilis]